jgi:hypothetical protein
MRASGGGPTSAPGLRLGPAKTIRAAAFKASEEAELRKEPIRQRGISGDASHLIPARRQAAGGPVIPTKERP